MDPGYLVVAKTTEPAKPSSLPRRVVTRIRGRRPLVLTVLDWEWAEAGSPAPPNGLGYNFSGRPDRQVSLRLTAELGRKEKHSAALPGIGDIEARAEVCGFNYSLTGALSISSSLRCGVHEPDLDRSRSVDSMIPNSALRAWILRRASTVAASCNLVQHPFT